MSILNVLSRLQMKPLIQLQGTGDCGYTYKYKNVFAAYVMDIEVWFETDLGYEQFCKVIDGEYSRLEVRELERVYCF
jgi:hypothetical protein